MNWKPTRKTLRGVSALCLILFFAVLICSAKTISTAGATLSILTPTASSKIIMHVVQKGETLGIIARKYGTTVETLVALNSIPNPDLIEVGQTLTVSVPVDWSPPPTPTPRATLLLTSAVEPTVAVAVPVTTPAVLVSLREDLRNVLRIASRLQQLLAAFLRSNPWLLVCLAPFALACIIGLGAAFITDLLARGRRGYRTPVPYAAGPITSDRSHGPGWSSSDDSTSYNDDDLEKELGREEFARLWAREQEKKRRDEEKREEEEWEAEQERREEVWRQQEEMAAEEEERKWKRQQQEEEEQRRYGSDDDS